MAKKNVSRIIVVDDQEFFTNKIVPKEKFFLNPHLLGPRAQMRNNAQLWIGVGPDGPSDNNDVRVLKERVGEELRKDKISPLDRYFRPSGIEAVDLDLDFEVTRWTWFEVNVAKWQAGIYRFLPHGKAYLSAQYGTPLRPIRDGQYSWPALTDEELMNLPVEQQKFLYLEPNKAGFCFRIEIIEDRKILPAGNGSEWIPNWPKIKKEVEKHYEEKIELAQQTK